MLGLEVHQAISDPSCFVFCASQSRDGSDTADDRFDSAPARIEETLMVADLHFPQTVLPDKQYFRDYLAATVPMCSSPGHTRLTDTGAKEKETTVCRVLECLN